MSYKISIDEYNKLLEEAEDKGEIFGGVMCPRHVQEAYGETLMYNDESFYDVEVPLGEQLVEMVRGKKPWRVVMRRHKNVD